MPLSLPLTPAQAAARDADAPFWRAVNDRLIAAGKPAATAVERWLYGRFADTDPAAARAIAWRISTDRWAAGDFGDRGRAAHAAIQRERHQEFLGSERYP